MQRLTKREDDRRVCWMWNACASWAHWDLLLYSRAALGRRALEYIYVFFDALSLTHIFVTQGARRRSLFITGSVSSHASHRELVYLTKFGSSGVPSLACTLFRRSQHNWNAPSSQQASNEFAQTKLHCSASANARLSLNKHIFGGAVASISFCCFYFHSKRDQRVFIVYITLATGVLAAVLMQKKRRNCWKIEDEILRNRRKWEYTIYVK